MRPEADQIYEREMYLQLEKIIINIELELYSFIK